MNRLRLPESALGLVAVLICAWPMTWLFQTPTWLVNGVGVLAVAIVLGALSRLVTRSRALVLLIQVLSASWLLLTQGLGSTLRFGLPTGSTWEQLVALADQAAQTIRTEPAPAPTPAGVTFWLTVTFVVLGVSVDWLAATRSAPAAAGFPLLVTFLASAGNRAEAMPWLIFLAALVPWLTLVARQGYAGLGRWSTTHASRQRIAVGSGSDGDLHGMASYSRLGRLAALAGVVVALCAPALLPQLPQHFIGSGLARDKESSRGGVGTVGFSTSADLERQLKEGSPKVVLQYRTNAVAAEPLKIVATSSYGDGQWQAARDVPGDAAAALVPVPPQPGDSQARFEVITNDVSAPHLASPANPVKVQVPGTEQVKVSPVSGDLYLSSRTDGYTVEYVQRGEAAETLRTAARSAATGHEHDLIVDPLSANAIRALNARILGGAKSPWEEAVAIQDHLRGAGGYSYTLTPPPAPEGKDMVSWFLENRQGYCTHYATAMIMMARSRGIPARLVMGYLPGTNETNRWTVMGKDAHAWPELWFEGAGWLRFEPTPGARSGLPPRYADSPAEAAPQPTVERPTQGPSTAPTSAPIEPPSVAEGPGLWERLTGWFSVQLLMTVLVVALLAMVVLVMPITQWIVRRRRRTSWTGNAVEVEWAELTSALDDLGLDVPTGATPRQLQRRWSRQAFLDDSDMSSLERVVTTLEAVRYADLAPTRSQTAAMSADAQQVRQAVAATRSRSRRIRAWLWPSSTVRLWRAGLHALRRPFPPRR